MDVVLVRRIARPVAAGRVHLDYLEAVGRKLGLDDVVDAPRRVTSAADFDFDVPRPDQHRRASNAISAGRRRLGEAQAVVGMLSGRDPAAMLEALLTAGIRSVVACAPHSPRALPAEVVAEAAESLGMDVSVATSPSEAVGLAIGRAGPDDRIVVCGSLYVVADARRLLVPDAV